jgi:hypothetical protein
VISLLRFALRLRETAEWGVIHKRRRYSDDAFTFSRPTYIKILGGRLDVAGIPYLDLYPPFAAAAPTQRLYKPFGTHWNIASNRLAAEQIADFLVARKLVGDVDPR